METFEDRVYILPASLFGVVKKEMRVMAASAWVERSSSLPRVLEQVLLEKRVGLGG
jgi:hypothetical protein